MKLRLTMILVSLFCFTGMALAQSIHGTVVSATDNEPIIGATVKVVGSKSATITDMDGRFAVNAKAGANLEISYIGMTTQKVKASDNMVVKLQADQTELEEVVVTGMTKMDRRLFTGATDKVNAEDALLGGVADVSRSLEGHSAGVSVQNVSGTFGTAPKINVRGATSIYGSSKPLWVVDGVVLEDVTDVSAESLSSGDAETLISSAVAGLNSDDIESFQILKDGSATSIYGARAMAGVIVITTKKGKAGQAHLNYTGEFTTRLIPSYSDFNIMNSQDQMGIYQELANKGWLTISNTINGSDYGVYGKMYEYINTYDKTTGAFGLQNTEEARNQYLRTAEMRNTNWFKELFSSAIMQNHAVSLSGGTAKSNYYASLSAMVDPGWYKQSSVNRYTANFNLNHRILDNLSVTILANASYRKQKAPGTSGQDVDVVSGNVKRDFDINPYSYALNSSRALDPNEYYQLNYAPFNILHELESNYIDLNVVNTKFQMQLAYNPIKDLELAVLGAFKYDATSTEHNILDDSNQALAYRAMQTLSVRDNNRYLYTDPDITYALPVSVLPQGGFYKRTDNRMVSYDFRATANYNHTFADAHILNVFGAFEFAGSDRTKSYFNGVGMQYAKGEVPFWVYQFFKKSSEENTDYYSLSNRHFRRAAFIGNLTYSYKGRYIVNGTIAYEGTNQLGRSNSVRWLPTWNAGVSWNVHEESFFKYLKPALSHLTFKASYSLTANSPDTRYTSSTVILKASNPWRFNSSDRETGIYISELENGELTYEKKHEFNFGVDAGFLKNRINLEFAVYTRNNYDLIGPIATQGVGGQVIRYGNNASMKGWGQEVTISSKNILKKDFKWETNFIFAHNETEITSLYSQDRTIDLIKNFGGKKVGYPVNALFSIPFMGLTEEGLPQLLTENGDITTWDINFQERDKTDYLKYEGTTTPVFTGSLGNIFTYKGFRLNVFITYSFGNVVRLDPVFSAHYTDLSSLTKEFNNRWMVPGDENKTTVPAILSYRQYNDESQYRYGYNAYNYSTERIAKGDFIRMKEISLSYDFPKAWFQRTALKTLSLKLQGTNLFLIYADKKLNGQDPEFFRSGGVSAPMSKQFTLTLKAGF
ncbi:MAG: SusC/RagA family TonB-linked outer membrane protein [Bacteroidaceae bacterium]|nr:SusC/RagA family TonB-linked outer membrane protein [Bacteroidaceae bacterium]